MNIEPANLAFYRTTIFFRRLQLDGVKHIVISPGSRSTVLTLSAAANKHFKKHIILDERSAAFTALGIAKATGIPPILICTSGTAVANYFPAVIEARKSGIPLILATADRPPNLRATGANQAIDQLKIFGNYPVFFHEVGEANARDDDLRRLEMLADQAVSISCRQGGPVHLNFPFRKPLEPTPDFLQKIIAENDVVKVSGWTHTESLHLSDELQQVISSAQKPLIIIGPTSPKDDLTSVHSLAKRLNAPILSESSCSGENSISKFAGFLRNKRLLGELKPDLILRFGFQPTVKSLELGLQNWQPKHHFHFASTNDWHDATYSNSKQIPWMGRSLRFDQVSPSAPKKWLQSWKEAEHSFQGYYQKSMTDEPKLTDGSVYHYLMPQILESNFIMVSNSFPARDIQLYGQREAQMLLFSNRGASGIDGITSTAIGINIGLQKPGVLFTGDLAFLHDTNALLNRKLLDQPLVVVVINNSGGSIFRMLPVEQHQQFFKPYFETPQSVDIEKLTSSYDISYKKIDSIKKLDEFDIQKWVKQHSSLSVIECQTDADASMKLRKKLWGF